VNINDIIRRIVSDHHDSSCQLISASDVPPGLDERGFLRRCLPAATGHDAKPFRETSRDSREADGDGVDSLICGLDSRDGPTDTPIQKR
jgi:hypothetical protein